MRQPGHAAYPYRLRLQQREVAAFAAIYPIGDLHVASTLSFHHGVSRDPLFGRWIRESAGQRRRLDLTLLCIGSNVQSSDCYELRDCWVSVSYQWHPQRPLPGRMYLQLLRVHHSTDGCLLQHGPQSRVNAAG